MNVRKKIAGGVVATAMAGGTLFGAVPAGAQQSQDAGAIGGLLAAVVQAQDITVTVVEVDDVEVDVAVQNVLNNNRILTNFLNNNNINVEDVVDIEVVDNTVFVFVDVL